MSGLRPPVSPRASGGAGAGGGGNNSSSSHRASSPVGNSSPNPNTNASRYSLGGKQSSDAMMRMAQEQVQAQQQQQQQHGVGGPTRSPSLGSTGQLPGTPRGLRPSSEMLHMAAQQQGTPEADAIDKWFEDLQHYEATLEEMAAASLDQNFKEELSAIEQWFRVLSEAERTAALYSLLQESTQVQIRFFITVLQQMARSDPMSALLSPNNPNSSMAEQMEQKLASMGLKSPGALKGPNSPYSRQSYDAAGLLSPNAAAMYGNATGSEAAAKLAAQRAKLKANRTSAPGTLAAGEGSRNFSGTLDQVQERSGSPNPSGDAGSRPKSTDGLSNVSRSPRASGPLDDQLSPISPAVGNWASMVNSPMVNMYDDKSHNAETNSNLDAAAAQLASMGQGNDRVVIDKDPSKFRRKSGHAPSSQQGGNGFNQGGTSSGMYDGNNVANMGLSPGLSPNMASGWGGMSTSPAANQFGFNIPVSPNALAGLQSPTGGMGNPLNMQMMHAMAAMGGLNNMNAAQFLAMQQQMLQQQQAMAAMAAQGQQLQQQQQGQQNQPGSAGGRSARQAFAGSFGNPLPSVPGSAGGRRSPRPGHSPGANNNAKAPNSAGGGGAGGEKEEEVADISVLNDVGAWLRQLRLHKYKPNFEGSTWREMVVMDDKALEEKGVAALGARRKMLKTFELVREKYNIPHPPGSSPSDATANASSAANSKADG